MENNNKKKILLVDTAFAALPIYEYLINSGFDVWVMGNRSDDVLAKKADKNWIEQDYSQVDEVAAHIDRLGIEYLVPGCTDVSIETCVIVGEGLTCLDSPKVNNILSNKSSFRELCNKLDLISPKVVDKSSFPVSGKYICKPVDAFSGRGVTVFDGTKMEDVVDAFKIAEKESNSSTAIVESYIEGQLYSYSAFVEKNRVITSFLVKEGSSANPFAVDTSFVEDALPGELLSILKNSIESISNRLKLKDGLVHAQFIFDGDKPTLIEMARRCPGDLYSLLIEYSTGFEYAAKYASYFVNVPYDTKVRTVRHVLRHTVTPDDEIAFGKLEFIIKQPVSAYYPLQAVGQPLLPNQKSRIGILFTKYDSSGELLNNYEIFMDRKAYRVR